MHPPLRTAPLLSLLAVFAIVVSGCGDDSSGSDTARSGAKSLTQAMNRAALAFDDLGSTRASLDRFGQDIEGPIAQTGDVIALLRDDEAGEKALLTAARQQRTFLQNANEAATSRTYEAASRAADKTRSAGRRAVASYARVISTSDDLAGLVPSATTFNSSELRRAIDAAWKGEKDKPAKESKKTGGSDDSSGSKSGGSSAPTGVTDCGGGVSAGNSATSCPFARNVADEYRASGGASTIDVYSPVTGQVYTMSCSGAGPVVCSGGNGAVVRIR